MRQFGRARSEGRYGKRHKPGVVNKTEAEYAVLLEARKLAGEIIAWEFEGITFKLADGCRYTPDFLVTLATHFLECVDCKGGGPMAAEGRVKIKCAAEKF